MLLYIIYNADLLDLPDNPLSEDAIGYIDDMALLATGNDFEETTHQLETIMKKEEGGLEWSKNHNSRFEVTKLPSYISPGKPYRTQTTKTVAFLYLSQHSYWRAR